MSLANIPRISRISAWSIYKSQINRNLRGSYQIIWSSQSQHFFIIFRIFQSLLLCPVREAGQHCHDWHQPDRDTQFNRHSCGC